MFRGKIQLKLAADVGRSSGIEPSRHKSRFFQIWTMSAGVLSLPELPNCLRRLVQPLTIRQKRNEFDGAEKLNRIRVWPAQWPQLARRDEQRNIFRRAVQQLRHLSSKQPSGQIFRRPCRHRRLCYVISRSHLGIGLLQAIPSGQPRRAGAEAAHGWWERISTGVYQVTEMLDFFRRHCSVPRAVSKISFYPAQGLKAFRAK